MAALPLIAAIISGVGTGVQVVGAIQASNAAAAAQEEQARIADENAKIELEKSAEDEKSFRVFSRKSIGDIKSGYAASGVTVDGSAGDILSESASAAEMDAIRIKVGGERRAKGLRDDADFMRSAASATRTGGYLSAAGSLASGAAKTAGYLDDYYSPTKLKRT